jgi:hypothetical protein
VVFDKRGVKWRAQETVYKESASIRGWRIYESLSEKLTDSHRRSDSHRRIVSDALET